MAMTLFGAGTSRGIAIGAVHLVTFDQPEVQEICLEDAAVADEVARYRAAVHAAQAELRAIRNHIPEHTAGDVSEFIDAHLLMLEDTVLAEETVRIIRERGCNAEWALKLKQNELVAVFEEMDDQYLRSRRDDVDHVINRIQRQLQGLHYKDRVDQPPPKLDGRIVVADDIAPAELVALHHQGIAGLVTEFGSPLSHTSILARSLHLPAVAGVHRARMLFDEDELLVVDGERGLAMADCEEGILSHYARRQRERTLYLQSLSELRTQPSSTADGVDVSLQANVELLPDIEQARTTGADGIGLYRTEFLYMIRGETPGEDTQYDAYLQAMEAMPEGPVTIRTLDLGADKTLDQVRTTTGPIATNPALGLRAVRLCLANPALFKPQVRALVRLSGHPQHGSRLRVMIPMLSSVREIFSIRHLIDATRREIKREGHPVAEHIPIGGMIEVPAAAVVAGLFAKHLDFMSIGTNDLIQYTLAMDRVDDAVSYLYDPLHPAVLRLLKNVIDAAGEHGCEVAMCGEMAGEPRYTRLLLGLGLRTLSMHPGTLLEVKKVVADTCLEKITPMAQATLRYSNPSTISEQVRRINEL